MSTVGHMRLSRFLAAFEAQNPGVDLSVTEGALDELKEKLQAGELDVCVMTRSDDLDQEFQTQPLYEERYVVVFPPKHRLAALNAVSLTDLSGERYVDRLACEMREMVMAVCKEQGVELYARFRSEREDWVQAMVLAGIGFAFMPEYSVTLPGLLQRPLAEPPVMREIAAVTVPGRRHSPAMASFMRTAHSFAWPG